MITQGADWLTYGTSNISLSISAASHGRSGANLPSYKIVTYDHGALVSRGATGLMDHFIFFVTIKPRYSSFFSIGPKDLKNVIFEKIGWALFEVAEVAHMKLSRIKKLKPVCPKNFSKLAQKRYFCICDLEAAHLTSMTSERAQ